MAARAQAVEQVLAVFYAAYDREPLTGIEKRIKVTTWASALEDVPLAQLLPLAHAELRERESPFLPTPADLIRRWNRQCGVTPEGGENTDAYLPYVPSWKTPPALPAAEVPLQIEPEELKRRLGLGVKPISKEEAQDACVPAGDERWSGFIVDIAKAGNIDLERCTPLQIADLRAFGKWWLANYPKGDLLQCDFAAMYAAFCSQRTPQIGT